MYEPSQGRMLLSRSQLQPAIQSLHANRAFWRLGVLSPAEVQLIRRFARTSRLLLYQQASSQVQHVGIQCDSDF